MSTSINMERSNGGDQQRMRVLSRQHRDTSNRTVWTKRRQAVSVLWANCCRDKYRDAKQFFLRYILVPLLVALIVGSLILRDIREQLPSPIPTIENATPIAVE